MNETGQRHEGILPPSEWVWWLAVMCLSLYGVFFIYSTGYISDAYPVRGTWMRHAAWLFVGLVGALFSATISSNRFAMRCFVWLGYGLSVLGLILVLFMGLRIGGARRWLSVGFMMVQPAEFGKLFTLLAVGWLLTVPERLKWYFRYGLILLTVAVPFCLIVLEPSVGNAFSLLPCTFAMTSMRLLWKRAWSFLTVFTVVCIVGGGCLLLWARGQDMSGLTRKGQGGMGVFRGYHVARLASYLKPVGGWNERQAIMTLASGGWTGKGYLEGNMKGLGYLPRTVAPTDFIFSVIGEEMGFLFGSLPIVLLYGGLIFLGLHWAGNSGDMLSCLSSVGVLTLLFTHIVVNIGMTVRLIPIIGLPLPLLSYGGSFTLATCLGLGIVYGAGRRYHSRERGLETAGDEGASRFSMNLLGLLKLTVVKKH